jgi:hypothetical protein
VSPPAAATRASFVLAKPLTDSNNLAAFGTKEEISLAVHGCSRRLGKGKFLGSGVRFVSCLNLSWRKQPWMRKFR